MGRYMRIINMVVAQCFYCNHRKVSPFVPLAAHFTSQTRRIDPPDLFFFLPFALLFRLSLAVRFCCCLERAPTIGLLFDLLHLLFSICPCSRSFFHVIVCLISFNAQWTRWPLLSNKSPFVNMKDPHHLKSPIAKVEGMPSLDTLQKRVLSRILPALSHQTEIGVICRPWNLHCLLSVHHDEWVFLMLLK